MIMFFGARGCGSSLENTPEGQFDPNGTIMMSYHYLHIDSSEERRRVKRIRKARKRKEQ